MKFSPGRIIKRVWKKMKQIAKCIVSDEPATPTYRNQKVKVIFNNSKTWAEFNRQVCSFIGNHNVSDIMFQENKGQVYSAILYYHDEVK